MTTILIKKKDTAGAPAPGDLTNAAGGTEIAVNTSTKRIYTKDAGGNVVELGTNASASTIDQLTVVTSATLSYGTANQVQYLNGSKILTGSANMTFNGTTFTLANDALVNGLTVGRGPASLNTNTVFGAAGMAANTTGYGSTAIGYAALTSNQTGFSNTAVGRETLRLNVSGSYNVAVGNSALDANTADYNTAVGFQSLFSNTSATFNTAVGYAALRSNTASSNTALGFQAGYATTSGSDNTFVGRNTANNNTTGAYNSAFGAGALQSNTTASNNTAVGYQAGYSNTTGIQIVAIGNQALYSNTTSNSNTAVGHQAGYLTTAGSNTLIGRYSGYAVTTGTTNTYVGDYSGANVGNSTGNNNVGVGGYALTTITSGASNTAVGMQSLASNTTASNNTAVGYQAGYSNTTATSNTFVGYRAGYSGVTAQEVTAVGYNALPASTGDSNSAFAERALLNNTTGTQNTAIGSYALATNTTGSKNVAVGREAGGGTTGSFNVAIGTSVLGARTSGGNNTAIGHEAGYSLTTGNGNVFVGYTAGRSTTGEYNTFVGNGPNYGAGYLVTSGSKNTILGPYNGNQNGLDIRTASNYIVLSDGDGTPQFVVNGSSQAGLFGQPFSGWDSARYRSLQFGNGTSARYFSIAQQYTAACSGSLLWNAYGDGDNTFKYSVTGDKASRMVLASDYFAFYGAATGTAGNAISWSTILGGQKDYTISLQDAASATGTGITFPATQNASSNANTLDDYEEGTWSPAFDGWNGSYTTRSGNYTKIGRVVTVSGVIESTGGTGTWTNYLGVNSFPFPGLSVTNGVARCGWWQIFSGTSGSLPANTASAGPLDGPSNGGTAAFCNVWKVGTISGNWDASYLNSSANVLMSFQVTYVTST